MSFWQNYTGYSARYDLSDVANMVLDENGRVKRAYDLSGNKRGVFQDDPTMRPTLELMTGNLTGIKGNITEEPYKKYLAVTGLSLPSPRTIFIVVKASAHTWLRHFSGGTFSRIALRQALRRMHGSLILEGGTYVPDTLEIWLCTFNTSASSLYVNTGQKISGAIGGAFPDVSINLLASGGGASPTDGMVGEYVRFGRVLETTEKNEIGSYLANKWGVNWVPVI